jgi:hypothetical protein
MEFRKAQRQEAKLRIGLFGPSGSGKTYSALLLAKGLVGDLSKVCVIDTENNSADLYSHLGDYSVLPISAPYSTVTGTPATAKSSAADSPVKPAPTTATPVRASPSSGSVTGGAGAVAAQRLGGIGVLMRFSFR